MAARLGVILLLLAASLAGGAARAQQLARLHVQSIALSSSTLHPSVDAPFDVTLTIGVRENVSGPFENVILPTFAGADELGDERVFSHGPHGSVYRETLRLVAHSPGPLAIGSAYLDAIDARDGKPKRFISNGLRLYVGAAPLDFWRPVRALLVAVVELALFVAALFVIVTIFRRRRVERPVPAPVPQPLPAPEAPPAGDDLDAEFDRLHAYRDRVSVLRVRSKLWTSIGAPIGDTLAGALGRVRADDSHTRRLLFAAERAAFIEDTRLSQAIEDLLQERKGRTA